MAPEMHVPDLAYNGPAIDIFACGLIVFTMFTCLQLQLIQKIVSIGISSRIILKNIGRLLSHIWQKR